MSGNLPDGIRDPGENQYCPECWAFDCKCKPCPICEELPQDCTCPQFPDIPVARGVLAMPYDPEVYELAKSVAEEADIKPTSYRHEDRRFVEHLAQMLQDIIEQEITEYCEQNRAYVAAKRAGEDV